jgi:sterol desaturase/sphingolipid hydroxylase (fatty acid hydroxylase superfamily)
VNTTEEANEVAMTHFVSNRDESVPLFQNPLLEFFSHTHPATSTVVYVPVAAYASYLSLQHVSPAATIGFAVAGMFIWTVFEYALHRWVFHWEPGSNWGKALRFWIHGIHHDYPRDHTRLIMPLVVSGPLAVLLYLLYTAAFGASGLAIYAGFALAYVAYDAIHYASHHLPAKSGLVAFLKAYHLAHHYGDERRGFGVTSPLWDYVLGTLPLPVRSARS